MKKVILLTSLKNESILIGVESIIDALPHIHKTNPYNDNANQNIKCTKISSRHAMVTTNLVLETVEEINNLINS